MTQLSDTDLSQGDIDVWFNWLRAGLIAYVSDAPIAIRYQAFAPLVVDPQSGSPASDIVQQIRTVAVQRRGIAESAAIEALRHWSLSSDGWRPAVLLISVAARLGGRGVADAILGLVARSGDLPADARAELAFVAVEAAKLRYKYSEIASLIGLLWAEDLATPQLLATFAVLLSRKDHSGLGAMPATLAKLMPALVEPPHTGDFVRVIAAALRRNFGIEELAAALRPIANEEPRTADFRRVLLELSGARSVESAAGAPERSRVVPLYRTKEANDRVIQRLAGLHSFGSSEELSELPFPDPADSAEGSEQ